MNKYLSTFISGFQDLIPKLLRKSLEKVHIHRVEDGLVLYETGASEVFISQLPYLNNSFLLIKEFGSSAMDLKAIFEWTLSKPDFWKDTDAFFKMHSGTARIVASKGNSMTSGYERYISEVEVLLPENVQINRSNPDYEIWFMERDEGGGFIGIRLTKSKLANLDKGELRPELAYLMCELSEPSAEDTFLDPFCGAGALVLARVEYFPYSHVIGGDKDVRRVQERLRAHTRDKKNIKLMKLDAHTLYGIAHASVDAIVTDPPWGLYEENMELESLYEDFVTSATQVLKPHGSLILLTAQKELMDSILFRHSSELAVIKTLDILVSGKKARLYKVKKG